MQRNDEPRPEMDDLLHDYFQAELPRSWPTFRAPRQQPTLSLWARSGSRMALAACIALLVGGYLTLGGSFTTPETTGLPKAAGEFGMREKGHKPVVTPTPPEDRPILRGETNKHNSK